jgi:hypothetical protein
MRLAWFWFGFAVFAAAVCIAWLAHGECVHAGGPAGASSMERVLRPAVFCDHREALRGAASTFLWLAGLSYTPMIAYAAFLRVWVVGHVGLRLPYEQSSNFSAAGGATLAALCLLILVTLPYIVWFMAKQGVAYPFLARFLAGVFALMAAGFSLVEIFRHWIDSFSAWITTPCRPSSGTSSRSCSWSRST